MLKCNPGKTEILHFTPCFSKQPTVYETLSLSTVEMTSKCSKLKWNQGSRASVFTVKFWSIREQTMENCRRFVFYNNIDSSDDIYVEVSLKIARARKRTKKLRHHHVISMVCSLIEQSSQPTSARGIAYLL